MTNKKPITTIILRQGTEKRILKIDRDIDYLLYALEEYGEREGWKLL
jgi:hypothetical protein